MRSMLGAQPGLRPLWTCPLVLFAAALAAPAAAQTVVFDQGPTTGTNGGCWTNDAPGQNFADKVTFAATTQVTAISIFTCQAPVATTIHVKILADSGGVPGTVLYSEDKAAASWAADVASGGYKIRVVLTTPFTAQGGVTYWYGLSGTSTNIAQYSVLSPGDGHMAQFAGDVYATSTSVGDQMFQLEGGPTEGIPALGGWGLAVLIGLLASAGVVALRRVA